MDNGEDFISEEFEAFFKNIEWEEACVTHMRVVGCIIYGMLPNNKRGKLGAKDTKCLFFGYCKGMKSYRLMCMEMNKS